MNRFYKAVGVWSLLFFASGAKSAEASPAGTPSTATPANVAPVRPAPPAAPLAAPAPPTIKPYDMGLTLPGLKFPWGVPSGTSPVQVTAGAGYQIEANFVPVTVPNLGLVPLVSVGGAALGDVTPSPTSAAYELSIGPEVCLIHAVCVSAQVDLVAGGPGGLGGLLPGKVGLGNFAGLLLYNAQNLLDAIKP